MPQIVAQITVTMTDDGKVNVNGPMENKILAYGLLEVGKEVVRAFNDQQAKLVQPAPPGSAEFLARERSLVRP
jgi:hypothetical protein